MCGLIGYATNKSVTVNQDYKNFFRDGLIVDSLRGQDATGIAAIGKDGQNHTYKKAMAAYDFVQLKETTAILNNAHKYNAMIGHNRLSTMAHGKDINSHPFVYDHITMVHNGVISNHRWFPNKADEDVDSAVVAVNLARLGEKETIEKLEGSFALVWHNAKDNTINFVRNGTRPLCFAFNEEGTAMFWASEWSMLYWLMVRNNIKVVGKFKEPAPNVWLKFNFDNIKEYTKTEVPSVPFVQAWKRGAWGGHKQTMYGPGIDAATTDKMTSGSTDDGGLSRSLQQFIKQDIKGDGRPTSPKHIAKAQKKLLKVGLGLGVVVGVQSASWAPNKNQIKLGTLRGTLHITTRKCVAYSIPSPMHKIGTNVPMYMQVVNITGPDKDPTIVVAEMCAPPNLPVKVHASEQKNEEREVAVLYMRGPGGRHIPESEWKELTKHGCAYCTGDLGPSDEQSILWKGDSPICWACIDSVKECANYNSFE